MKIHKKRATPQKKSNTPVRYNQNDIDGSVSRFCNELSHTARAGVIGGEFPSQEMT